MKYRRTLKKKGRSMLKNSMKSAGLITLFALILPLGSASAEEKLPKDERGMKLLGGISKIVKAKEKKLSEEELAEKLSDPNFVAGHIVLLAQRHLNEEENKALSELITRGVERSHKIHSESENSK